MSQINVAPHGIPQQVLPQPDAQENVPQPGGQPEPAHWEVAENQARAANKEAMSRLSGKGGAVAKLFTEGTSAKKAAAPAPTSGWSKAFKIIGHIFTVGIFKLGFLIADAISDSVDKSNQKAVANDVVRLRDALATMDREPQIQSTVTMVAGERVVIGRGDDGGLYAEIDGQRITTGFSARELVERIEDDIVTDVALYGKDNAMSLLKKSEEMPINVDDVGDASDRSGGVNTRHRELCLKAIKANMGVDAGELHSCNTRYLNRIAGYAVLGDYTNGQKLINHMLQVTTTSRVAADDIMDIMDLRERDPNAIQQKVNVSVLRPPVNPFATATQQQVHTFVADMIYSGDIVSEDKLFSEQARELDAEARKMEKIDASTVLPPSRDVTRRFRAQADAVKQAERLRHVLTANAGVIADMVKVEAGVQAVELETKAREAEALAAQPNATPAQKLEARAARAEANAAQFAAKGLRGSLVGKAAGFFGSFFSFGAKKVDESKFIDLERKACLAEAKALREELAHMDERAQLEQRLAQAQADSEEAPDDPARLSDLVDARKALDDLEAQIASVRDEATAARLAVRLARADAQAALGGDDAEQIKAKADDLRQAIEDAAPGVPDAALGAEFDVPADTSLGEKLTSLEQLPEDQRASLLSGLQPEDVRTAVLDMLEPVRDGLLEQNAPASRATVAAGIGKIEVEDLIEAVGKMNTAVEQASVTIQEEMISAILLMDAGLTEAKLTAAKELRALLDAEHQPLTQENMEAALRRESLPAGLQAAVEQLSARLEGVNDDAMRQRLARNMAVKTLTNFAELDAKAAEAEARKAEAEAQSAEAGRASTAAKNALNGAIHATVEANDALQTARNKIPAAQTRVQEAETAAQAAAAKLAELAPPVDANVPLLPDQAYMDAKGEADAAQATLAEARAALEQANAAVTEATAKSEQANQAYATASTARDAAQTVDENCKAQLAQAQREALAARRDACLALGLEPPKAAPEEDVLVEGDGAEAPQDAAPAEGIQPEAPAAGPQAPLTPHQQRLEELRNTSLEKLMASSGMDFSSNGYGKFLKTAIMNYFHGIPLTDKRSMISAGLRYAPPNATPTQLLGAMLKGAGPILQKTFQGLDGPGLPMDLRQACKDMKSRLAPIPPDIVEATLLDMVQSSHGRISKIEVLSSLGAATVGQAFKCRLTDQHNQQREIVVKILRPDVANRAQRERGIFENAAAQVDGMAGTFAGQMRQIMQELDFTIETANIRLGGVYDEPFDIVDSVKAVEDIPPKSNYLAMELAPGTTMDEYFSSTREEMRRIGEPCGMKESFEADGNRSGVSYTTTFANVPRLTEARGQLLEMYRQAKARHRQLTALSENWVKNGILSPNGFFHGDLHAGNIMSDGKTLTVIDFGNATQLNVDQQSAVMTMAVCAGTQQTTKFLKAFRTLLRPEAQRHFDGRYNELLESCRVIMKKGESADASAHIMCILTEIQRHGIEIPQEIMNFAFSEMRLQNTVAEMLHLMDQIRENIRAIDSALAYLYDTPFDHDKKVAGAYEHAANDTHFVNGREVRYTTEELVAYLEREKNNVLTNPEFRAGIVNDMTLALPYPHMREDLKLQTLSKDPQLLAVWQQHEATLENSANPGYQEAFDAVVDAVVQSVARRLDAVIADVRADVSRERRGDDFLDVMSNVLEANKKTATSRLGVLPSARFAITSFLSDKFPNTFDPKI